MKTYSVMAISDEDFQKTKEDSKFAPVEFEVATIECWNESLAQVKVRNGVFDGVYPKGSQAVEKIETKKEVI